MKFIKRYWLLLVGLVVVLPTLWPIFRNDFFQMHDWLHVARLVELDEALKAGLIPPRWTTDFGWGYGMPLFNFYAPLPYYLAELLYLIKIPALWAIKLVFAANYFAGFYFMYLLGKTVWNKWGGLMAAASFTYLPYRAVQFYVRGSLGELTAMTLLPLFYYAALKLTREKSLKYLLMTAVSITGIFLSHNIIALFAVFFLPLFMLFFIRSWRQWLATGLIAFGLSAFFILPAFLEKNLTVVDQLADGYSRYWLHFIYLRQLVDRAWAYGGSILGPEDDISFQLGLPQLLLILPSLLLIKKKKAVAYAWLALLASVFMMTFHSKFIWDRLTILHIAQFPWRLLSFAAMLVAFLTGAVRSKWVIPLILLTMVLNWSYFRPVGFMDSNVLYFTDKNLIAAKQSEVLPDYLPKTANTPSPLRVNWFETEATVSSVLVKPGSFAADLTATRSARFNFNQYYFPGWQGNLDGQTVSLGYEESIGRISLIVPEGAHHLKINLAKTRIQLLADIISLVTVIGIGLYLIKLYAPKFLRA